MIFEQTCDLLINKYRTRTEDLYIADLVIGLNLTAVRLSDNSVGVASNISENHNFCTKGSRDFGDLAPLKIKGRNVTEILKTGKESGIISSLKTAVINAVSSGLIPTGKYRIIDNCDPIDLIDLSSGKTISVVGAFQSYIQKIASTANRLFILELNEKALSDEQRKYFIQADKYPEAFSVSDIVIITGQTLVNHTIDDLLSATSPRTLVIVTGPSAGILPEIMFENGVDIIGSTRITKPELLFDVVSQGGAGYHLFEYCAKKICILNESETQA